METEKKLNINEIELKIQKGKILSKDELDFIWEKYLNGNNIN